MLNVPSIKEYMTDWLIRLKPDTDVYVAIDALVSQRASGAVVVDANGTLLGLLTEKDCLRVISGAAYGELAGGAVADYMSRVRTTVNSNMDLIACASAFLETNFTVLPVVDDGRLVGRIGRQDILQGILDLNKQLVSEMGSDAGTLRHTRGPLPIQRMQQMAANATPEQIAAMMSQRHTD